MNNSNVESKGFFDIAFVFAGLTLSVTAFVVGSNLGLNLSLASGILAIVIGNTILALYSGFIGIIGMKTKESSSMIAKPAFGIYGQIISSFTVVTFLMGFVAVYASMIGNIIHKLIPQMPLWTGSVLFIVCICITTIFGFTSMSKLSKIAVPLLGIFVGFGLYKVNQLTGLTNVANIVPTGDSSFGVLVSSVIATWISAATFSSDITRFAKSSSHVFGITFFAFGCTTILETVGLVCALGAGSGDLVSILAKLGIIVPALFIYLLLMWTSAQTLLYSFSLALMNIQNVLIREEKISEQICIVIGATLALIGSIFMSYMGFTSSFQSFLLTIGVAIPPIGGILIAHYLLVYGITEKSFENMPKIRYTAFVAWLCGIAVAKLFNIGIPALQGFITTIIIYSILELTIGKKLNISSAAK